MKILEELDTININERFIFPELEYTVKYIKEKYWSPYKDYRFSKKSQIREVPK